jgi:hypothetical protein
MKETKKYRNNKSTKNKCMYKKHKKNIVVAKKSASQVFLTYQLPHIHIQYGRM